MSNPDWAKELPTLTDYIGNKDTDAAESVRELPFCPMAAYTLLEIKQDLQKLPTKLLSLYSNSCGRWVRITYETVDAALGNYTTETETMLDVAFAISDAPTEYTPNLHAYTHPIEEKLKQAYGTMYHDYQTCLAEAKYNTDNN